MLTLQSRCIEIGSDRREQGFWKASELQWSLAEHGLAISAGKMSGLWSGQPVSLGLSNERCNRDGWGYWRAAVRRPSKVMSKAFS
ncbi:hypothetical protein ACFW2F_41415, partial [Streptomyces tendae]